MIHDRSSIDGSSSRARAGEEALLDPRTRQAFRSSLSKEKTSTAPSLILVRDEGEWAIDSWAKKAPLSVLKSARETFLRGLIRALERAFALRPSSRNVRIGVRSLDDERAVAARMIGDMRVISLDPCSPGDVDLGISRRFELGSSTAPKIVARPGSPPLEIQLARIPPGEYVLLDDDIATGQTVDAITRMLPKHCTIVRSIFLSNLFSDDDGNPRAPDDLVDCRDFLLGSREAGLVVALPNGDLARAPYVHPYVRPADRISSPPAADISLSQSIWRLNREFFSTIGDVLCVEDTNPQTRMLLDYVGFADEVKLTAICDWHLERLVVG
jgi:hypothetical protein